MNLNTIFDQNAKIHRKTIEEQENRRLESWLKRINQETTGIEDLRTIFLMSGTESNRVIKTCVHHALKKWERKEKAKEITETAKRFLNETIKFTN